MGRPAACVSLVLVLATAAGCSDDPAVPSAARVGTVAPARAASAEDASKRAAAPHTQATTEEIDALIATWREVADTGGGVDPALLRARTDALVAAGRPALDRMFERALAAGDDEHGWLDDDLVLAFGPAAVDPLLARLGSEDAYDRRWAMRLLGDLRGAWAFGEQGPTVCRMLAARLATDPQEASWAIVTGRPASRAVARDLAEAWAKAEGNDREHLGWALLALGTDAVDAEPVLVAAVQASPPAAADAGSDDATDEADQRAIEAVAVLRDLHAGDASFVPTLRKLLADAAPAARPGLLGLLATCGDAAAPAAKEVAAYLRDSEQDVVSGAALVLAALRSVDDTVLRDLIRANENADVLSMFVKDPAFAARLADKLAELPAAELQSVHWALERAESFDMTTLAPTLLRHPLPAARRLALEPWSCGIEVPLPPGAAELLKDPDPTVRAEAAHVLAGRDDVPQERVLEAALALRTAADEDVRASAVSALGSLAAAFPQARAALREALSDASAKVRVIAAESLDPDDPAATEAMLSVLAADEDASAGIYFLARSDRTIPGDHAALLATLIHFLIDRGVDARTDTRLEVALRLEGGLRALQEAVERTLAPNSEADHWDRDHALALVESLGPRFAALRPTVIRLQEAGDASLKYEVERAIAAIDAPPKAPTPDDTAPAPVSADAVAHGRGELEEVVTRLLGMGEPGRRAILSYAARDDVDVDALLARLANGRMDDLVRDAARSDGAEWRGAVVLAPLLPPKDAVVLLDEVSAGDDPSDVVVRALLRVERNSPGAVPGALAVRLLRDAEGKRDADWMALPLAELVGKRAADADPSLLTEFREMRDGPTLHDRCVAATALWHLTGVQDEALPTLRWVLDHPERIGRFDVDQIPWRRVGRALGEMRLGDEDVAAIVVTLRAASAYVPIERDEVAQTSDSVSGALGPLCGVIKVLGPRGATAVPALRVALSHWRGWPGQGIVETLGAIGPAARDAVPDIRAWIASSGDEHGAGRNAIAKIESAPR